MHFAWRAPSFNAGSEVGELSTVSETPALLVWQVLGSPCRSLYVLRHAGACAAGGLVPSWGFLSCGVRCEERVGWGLPPWGGGGSRGLRDRKVGASLSPGGGRLRQGVLRRALTWPVGGGQEGQRVWGPFWGDRAPPSQPTMPDMIWGGDWWEFFRLGVSWCFTPWLLCLCASEPLSLTLSVPSVPWPNPSLIKWISALGKMIKMQSLCIFWSSAMCHFFSVPLGMGSSVSQTWEQSLSCAERVILVCKTPALAASWAQNQWAGE